MPEDDITIRGIRGMPEVMAGASVGLLLARAIEENALTLQPGDVLVVTHKIVSKAEGRTVPLDAYEPSAEASDFAGRWGKDPRQVQAVLQEAVRIVRMERGVIIAETVHGFVCANAGIDASNTAAETICLLPVDPDASAQQIRESLHSMTGVAPGVIISDSFGRPWRNGIVNVAIGVAGIAPIADYRGLRDPAGYELNVSELAVADELAGAAELVMNKLDRVPAALIRGYQHPLGGREGSARDLIRDASIDLFR